MTVTELSARAGGAHEPATAQVPGEHPAVDRWQPRRAGILNVWRYYDEVFEFHRGRLLLRGPNGSGKSKALEVLLPFLFDASLRPGRLSTFGTADRTMHWNLMGEGAAGVTRVGYVWLELERAGERPAWFTCGARLQASTHTSTVHADFFTTSQRIGLPGGLSLLSGEAPLTRAALAGAIGDAGAVHGSATEYRATVRQTLFPGMTEQRFEALITALLQLRTPKLSQRLDPSLLSTLLSRALPPLDQAEIAELAEGFERLDRQREQLRRMDDEVAAAETVAARARTYGQRVLRRAAARLIAATTAMDELTRTARESDAEYDRVTTELGDARERASALRTSAGELRARIDGLRESESYKQGQELDRLRRQVQDAGQRARHRRAAANRHIAAADEAGRLAVTAIGAAERRASDAELACADVDRVAERVSLPVVVDETRADAVDPRTVRRVVQAAIERREAEIAEVRSALARRDEAVAARTRVERDRDEATALLAETVAAREAAQDELGAAVEEQADRLDRWATGCTELSLDGAELAALAHDEAAVLQVVAAARSAAESTVAAAEVRLRTELDGYVATRSDVRAELAERRAAADLQPPAPATRTADRTARAGAPLWRLTAFAADVPAQVQAGVEAALEASGLLDAWISPDGTVLDGEDHDAFLLGPRTDAGTEAGTEAGAESGEEAGDQAESSLADVLVPADGTPVPRDVVTAILRDIRFGASLPATGTVAIGADGAWRVATLTGTWRKSEPAYIGATAREQARQRRIAELTAAEGEADGAIGRVDLALDALEARLDRLRAELAARPDHAAPARAEQALHRAEARVESGTARLAGCTERLQDAERQVTAAIRDVTTAAAERGLPADCEALDRLGRGLRELSHATDAWLDAHTSWQRAADVARVRSETADTGRRAADEAAAEAAQAEDEAAELATRLDAVEGAVAAPYQEVLADLERHREELADVERQQERIGQAVERLSRRVGELDARRLGDAGARDRAVTERDVAAERFRTLASGTLAEDAGLPMEPAGRDGVKGTLEAARSAAAAWPAVPHEPRNVTDALSRLTEAVYRSQEALVQRADLELETIDDVQVLITSVDGLRLGAAGLLAVLREQRNRSRDDITAAEHELFDTTLTGATRRHLAARIRQAGELVEAMNSRLDRVRTSSKVAVRLTWQVDPTLPPGTRAARDLLLRDPARLSDGDREALHTFLRQRIEEARGADTAASWDQQLADVFDYTAWHQFVVKVDRANGAGWQVLTKKLHGALSGGEKAIALHLPLFAAVAAHYHSIPAAPRLILLDEVFVGVDVANRGQVFGLLSALDLDLVLTSDHEWCTYRELDGIGVHQLLTGDGDDAVTTVRFTWDGYQLTTQPATPPDETPPD